VNQHVARPIGVTIIAVILFVHGVLAFALALLAIGHFGPFQIFFQGFYGFVLIYLGYSMFQLELWAWMTTLVIEILNAIFGAITALFVPGAGIYRISVAFAIIVIIYLNQSQIRSVFTLRGTDPWSRV
jgi:hypothetical protein